MINSIKNIQKIHFLKNVATLSGGIILGQLIAIVAQLVLRRMFPAEAFGSLGVYMQISGILVVFANLRYDLAIVTSKTTNQAVNLLYFILLWASIFSIILAVLLVIFQQPLASWLNLGREYVHWLYFMPISVFLFSSFQAINYLLIKEKRFAASSSNKVIRRTVESGVQIIFGFLKTNSGLLIGEISGHLANFTTGCYQVRKLIKANPFSFNKVKKVAIKFIDFPKYNALPALLNTASLALPLILVNKIFSSEIAGYFDLSLKMIAVPFALITSSISQVFLQKASEKINKSQSILIDILKIAISLSLMSGIGILVIQIWGINLFSFVFGEQYGISGQYTQILIWGFALKFVVSPLSNTFIAYNKLKLNASWQIAYFIIITSLYFIKFDGIRQFLFYYMFIDLFMYFVYFIMIITLAFKKN